MAADVRSLLYKILLAVLLAVLALMPMLLMQKLRR